MDQHLVREVSVFGLNFYLRMYTYVHAVQCTELTDPINGMITCSLINSPSFSYEDTCSFTCNTGYELTGNNTRTCQNDRSWSGSNVTCNRGKHTIR